MNKKISKYWQPRGFTLVELIISIMISGIILVFLFSIVTNVVRDIQTWISSSKTLTELATFTSRVNDYKNFYLSGTVLVDNLNEDGADTVLLTDLYDENGIIIAVLDADRLKPEKKFSANLTTKKLLWYREVIQWEISELRWNPAKVYEYKFQKENVLHNVVIKDFQAEFYNSGGLLDINVHVNTGFRDGMDTLKYSDVGNENIERYNFNF